VEGGPLSRTVTPALRDRAVGALLGLAVGDALGTTNEFSPPGSFVPLTDMVGGGPFNLAPGQFTDDTSMALCLGESLLACAGFDAHDQATRYRRWWREGHWSSTGECFDIGNVVRQALTKFERGDAPPWGPVRDDAAGNGFSLRLAPVPIYWHDNAAVAITMAAESSRVTHGTATAVDACRFAAGLMVGALTGVSKADLLSPDYSPLPGGGYGAPLHPLIAEIARGSYHTKSPPDIKGTGYVVHSLEAALWALATTENFHSGALAAVNLGDDADTTGAIFGQIAGACYGAESIPRAWRERITRVEEIIGMAERLVAGA
jgi:ADP-ribosylglycohydrolase